MKQINKIAKIVVLTFAGIILNIVSSGNFIVPMVGCLVLGYLVNRSDKPSSAKSDVSKHRPSKLGRTVSQGMEDLRNFPARSRVTSTTRNLYGATPIQCRTCGAVLSSSQRFCTRCGSETGTPRGRSPKDGVKYNPEYIRVQLEKVRDRDEAAYQDLVRDTLMVDDWGRYWSVGAVSSKWYVYENGGWIQDQPASMIRPRGRAGAIPHEFLSALGGEASTVATVQPPPLPRTTGAPRRFCVKCGNRLQEGHRFCRKCGTPIAS